MRKVAWAIVIGLVALAVLADFVASDRPILMKQRGSMRWFMNLGDGEPRGERLRKEMGEEDWAIWAPIDRDPVEVRTRGKLAILERPSATHRLGTDDRGRDVAARLVHGTRTTVEIAIGATVLALLLGIGLALLAVGAGGVTGRGILVACDAVAAAPPVLTVIAAQGLVGARGMVPLIVLIAVPRVADTARLCAGGIRRALAEPFIEAARATGAARARVLVRHALPQTAPAMAAAAALTAATAVLSEAALAFLGVGMPAPTPSWGELLAQAMANDLRWWLAWPSGIAITLATWALITLARPRILDR